MNPPCPQCGHKGPHRLLAQRVSEDALPVLECAICCQSFCPTWIQTLKAIALGEVWAQFFTSDSRAAAREQERREAGRRLLSLDDGSWSKPEGKP